MSAAMHGSLIIMSFILGPRASAQGPAPFDSYGGVVAGLYSGTSSSFNGPFLAARYGRGVARVAGVGVRLEYRDDDRSRGRVQSLGVGPEAFLHTPTTGVRFHGVVGILVDGVLCEGCPSFGEADLRSGLYVRAHLGAGASIHAGAMEAGIEIARALEGGSAYTMVGLAIRSHATGGRSAPAPVAHLQTNGLVPLTDRYQPEPSYRGYSMAVDVNGRTPLGRAIRMSFGIDFLEFDDYWSTGVVTLLVGTVGDLYRTPNGAFGVALVPQVGGALFMEPAGSPPYPFGAISLEPRMRFADLGLAGSVGIALTKGPAGMLPAVPWRLGVVVGL
jgi:hypothetical protein